MTKAAQIPMTLEQGLQATYASATASLMGIIRSIDANECPKRATLIGEIGIKTESHLSEALNAKGRAFPVAWLPAYVRHDRRDLIANEIARWKDLRCTPLRPRSPAEKLARLERVLDAMGVTGDFIRERAAVLPDAEQEEERGR